MLSAPPASRIARQPTAVRRNGHVPPHEAATRHDVLQNVDAKIRTFASLRTGLSRSKPHLSEAKVRVTAPSPHSRTICPVSTLRASASTMRVLITASSTVTTLGLRPCRQHSTK